MKKKIIATILILGCVCVLFGCGKGQLASPQDLHIENGMLYWSPVENADLYAVFVGNDQYETKEVFFDLSDLNEGNYLIEIMAVDAEGNFSNSAVSKIEYTVEQAFDPFEEGTVIYENLATKNLKYTLLEDGSGYEVSMGGANLRGEVIIPDYYKGLPVRKISDYAFFPYGTFADPSTGVGCNTVTTAIRLPGTLREIGECAFAYCLVLEKINLPNGLKTIGESAFSWNTHLAKITIPESVKRIEDRLFSSCHNLSEINFPQNIEYFSSRYAVAGTAWLNNQPEGLVILNDEIVVAYVDTETNIIDRLPDGIKRIADWAFSYNGIKAFSMEKWVDVGKNAFANCKDLASVTLPDDCTAIPEHLFSRCESLKEIDIPGNVTSIGDGAFSGSGLKQVELPEGCETIGNGAFSSCKDLTSAIIPPSVTCIGKNAFMGSGLAGDLVLEHSVEFGESAFKDCINLNSVKINCKTVPSNLFSNCDALKTVTVEGCTEIGNSAFFGTDLESIVLPQGVETIGRSAFLACVALKDITLPGSLQTIGDNAFQTCVALKAITLPEGLQTIGNSAFASCSELKDITLPESLQAIGDNAFESCVALKDITLPGSLQAIGDGAFAYCSALTEIIIPDSVESVGNTAFFKCSNIEALVLPTHLAANAKRVTDLTYSQNLTVYYKGTPEEWDDLAEGNLLHKSTTICFYAASADVIPADGNTYWRFVGNAPEKWVLQ